MELSWALVFTLTLLFYDINVAESQSVVCAPGQTHIGESCYVITWEQSDWNRAFDLCQRHQGRLVQIPDENSQAEVSALLRSNNKTTSPTLYWIGARSGYNNEVWWIDQNDLYAPVILDFSLPENHSTYSNWLVNRTVYDKGPTCLLIDDAQFKWSTMPCNTADYGSICQYNPAETPVIKCISSQPAPLTYGSYVVTCVVTGFPQPNITWHKNGVLVGEAAWLRRITSVLHVSYLTIPAVNVSDSDQYECRASVWNLTATNSTKLRMSTDYPEGQRPCEDVYGDEMETEVPTTFNTSGIDEDQPSWGADNRSLESLVTAMNQELAGQEALDMGQISKLLTISDFLKSLSEYAEGLTPGLISMKVGEVEVTIEKSSDMRSGVQQNIWVSGLLEEGVFQLDSANKAEEVTTIIVEFPPLKEDVIMENGVYKAVASKVLSYTRYEDGEVVSVPVGFRLKTENGSTAVSSNQTHQKELQCGFMEEIKLGGAGWGWSTEGCVLRSVEDGYATCACEHTTNFALIMQVVPIQISSNHVHALSIITYTGCGISMSCLLLAFTVFVVLRLHSQDRTFIHMNLVVTLFLLQIVFLTGASQINIKALCTAVSVCLHYLALAAFSWMLVEGIHLYRQIVTVFDSKHHKAFYALMGYLLPGCIVGLSGAIHSQGYTDPDRSSCWLSMKDNFHWAFIGPAIFIILVNTVITGTVLRIVISAARVTKQRTAVQVAGKGLFILAPITGLSWVFALFAVSEETLVFQYLFACLNSLQGMFIFLFQCVFNTEVQNALRLWKTKRSAGTKVSSLGTGNNEKKRIVRGSSSDTTDKTHNYTAYFAGFPELLKSPTFSRSVTDPVTKKPPVNIPPVCYKDTARMDYGHNPPSPGLAWMT